MIDSEIDYMIDWWYIDDRLLWQLLWANCETNCGHCVLSDELLDDNVYVAFQQCKPHRQAPPKSPPTPEITRAVTLTVSQPPLFYVWWGSFRMQPSQRNNHCIVGKSNALWGMSWTTRSCNKDESWLIIVIKRSKANSRTQHKFARGYNRKMMENVDKPLWSLWCWAIPAGQTLSRRMLHARAFSLLVLHFGQVLTALTSLSELLPLCMCQETRHP